MTYNCVSTFLLSLLMVIYAYGQIDTPTGVHIFKAEGGVIPDHTEKRTSAVFPITVSNLPTDGSSALYKVCFSAVHARTSDLKFELKAPNNNSIWLSNRNGGLEGRNYANTCFSQGGFSGYIHQAEAPFRGDYTPDGRFSFLTQVDNPNGEWQLIVHDLSPGVEGFLTFVQLTFADQTLPKDSKPCSEETPQDCHCSDNSDNCTLLPDLVLLEEFTASNIHIYSADHQTYPNQLRFSVSIANIGEGPMEVILRNEREDGDHKVANISQVLYHINRGQLGTQLSEGGVIFYDDSPGHDHYHVDDWVEFSLYRIESWFYFWKKRIKVAQSRKVSFCLFDSGICDGITDLCTVEGIKYGPQNLNNYGMGNYIHCDKERQGISVGGYDTYGYNYEGQHLDLPPDLPSADYELVLIIDPSNLYQETTKANNTTVVQFKL